MDASIASHIEEIERELEALMPLKRYEAERQHLISSYRTDVAKFLAIASASGVPVRTGRSEAWIKLQDMLPERLKAYVDHFAAYREVCHEAILSGSSITDEKQLLWRMIGRWGWIPASDLMDKIEEGDVIEVYDLLGNQIYRNLRFYRVSSYTFEELMHYPHYELFGRPMELSRQLLGEVAEVLSGRHHHSIYSQVPEHIAFEMFSLYCFRARIQPKVISPLFGETGAVEGVVYTSRVEILGERR